MSDINAKREARRRRILDNSDDRLRRITLRNNTDEDNFSRIERDQLNEHDIRNGVCTGITTTTTTTTTSTIDDDVKLPDYSRLNFAPINNCNDTDCSRSTGPLKELHRLLAKRICLIWLASLVNILLLLELDNWFGKAITIPYLLYMIIRLCTSERLYGTRNEDDDLLIAALILCNIKSDFIYRFKLLFRLFTTVINDFSLYIFSFVLMRYIIVCYYDAKLPINIYNS